MYGAMKLNGIAVFEGIVFGKALVYRPFEPAAETYRADFLETEAERLAAYQAALRNAQAELDALAAGLEAAGSDKAKIFLAQRALLADVAVNEEIHSGITKGIPVSRAVLDAYDPFIRALEAADIPLIRERSADLADVRNRLLRCLCQKSEANLSKLDGPAVIFAHELFPSDTAALDQANTLAIVTERGGATSHTAIMARSYGIPAVLNVSGVMGRAANGDDVIVDAVEGAVLLRPAREEAEQYRQKRERWLVSAQRTDLYRCVPAVTADGVRVEVEINISGADALSEADVQSSDGCGLMRSEFLYMESGGQLPDEEQQFRAYRAAVLAFGGKPVVLRTLDIGCDKQLPCIRLPREENPALGKRALRVCFDDEALFRTQLRAALRASGFGDLRIMFPMVGGMEDIRRAKAFVYKVMDELEAEGVGFNRNIKLGVMIEVPAIALIADKAAGEVDFGSIGTNDLCQYVTAADRLSPAVSGYYQEFHPAMFRLIGEVARAFRAAGKPLCICGELGGNPKAIPVLLGLGIRTLSMNAAAVAGAKRVIANVSVAEAGRIAKAVCQMDTAAEAEAALTDRMREIRLLREEIA